MECLVTDYLDNVLSMMSDVILFLAWLRIEHK